MIQLKRCNYITGEPTDIGFAVTDIINFLEVDGRNPLLITPTKNQDSTNIKYFYNSIITFENFSKFSEILSNKSNLFRVDLLVFDFYHLSPWQISDYKKIIDQLNIDHIIIAKEYHYKTNDDVNDFHVRREYRELRKSDLFITDNINNWTSTLKSLAVSYVRDKKIDNLFGDDI